MNVPCDSHPRLLEWELKPRRGEEGPHACVKPEIMTHERCTLPLDALELLEPYRRIALILISNELIQSQMERRHKHTGLQGEHEPVR